MRLFRWALIAVLLVILGMAIHQSMLWLGVWGGVGESEVKALEAGDQEIALIEPATSTEDWGRIVTALKLLEADWSKINPDLPTLRIDFKAAFPPLTAEVPEIVFGHASGKERLRLRWYKISGEHDVASWIKKLEARRRPPLAIIGGGTSDRAIKLANALKETYEDPERPSPIFLMTTATSENTVTSKALIDVYRGRTFRFSFTNKKMVDALLAFVQHRAFDPKDRDWAESLWVSRGLAPAFLGAIGFSEVVRPAPRPLMHSVTWEDERYSQDMTDLFEDEFKKRFPTGEFTRESPIRYGIGGFSRPTPEEENVIGTFLARPLPPTFLVLPTQTMRMRRMLIDLRLRSPLDARNLVILNGDAISFHSIYRDRDVMWRILDLPYSLVFFAHRNPIDHAAGFAWTKEDHPDTAFPRPSTTGTHDILLYRDLFEAILYAAYDQEKLLGDSLQVRARLQATRWYNPPPEKMNEDRARVRNPQVHPASPDERPFFSAKGNRQSQTGEHIVWLKPSFTEDRVDLTSKISVWTMQPDTNGGAWRLVEAADATYNQ